MLFNEDPYKFKYILFFKQNININLSLAYSVDHKVFNQVYCTFL